MAEEFKVYRYCRDCYEDDYLGSFYTLEEAKREGRQESRGLFRVGICSGDGQ